MTEPNEKCSQAFEEIRNTISANLLLRAKEGSEVAIQILLDLFEPLIIKYATVNNTLDLDLKQRLKLECYRCLTKFDLTHYHVHGK